MEKCYVCGSKGSTVTSTNDLDVTHQARFEEQHLDKATVCVVFILDVVSLTSILFFFCTEDSNLVSTTGQRKQNCDNCCQEDQTWSSQAHGTVNVLTSLASMGCKTTTGYRFANIVGRWIITRRTPAFCWPKIA